MLENICDENLVNIISYLNNKDSLNFVKLSKYNKNLFYKRGFLKHISSINSHSDPFDFAINFSIHNKTLQSVHVSHIQNPQYYMNGTWPKNVLINFCRINSQINPTTTKTEKLKIEQIYYHTYKKMINWNKFTKLKVLYLSCTDIDFTGFENCKDLEIIFIELKNADKVVLPNISSLKNLKHLITNCSINDETHFQSKQLKTCITKNIGDFKFQSDYPVTRNKFYYSLDLIYKNL